MISRNYNLPSTNEDDDVEYVPNASENDIIDLTDDLDDDMPITIEDSTAETNNHFLVPGQNKVIFFNNRYPVSCHVRRETGLSKNKQQRLEEYSEKMVNNIKSEKIGSASTSTSTEAPSDHLIFSTMAKHSNEKLLPRSFNVLEDLRNQNSQLTSSQYSNKSQSLTKINNASYSYEVPQRIEIHNQKLIQNNSIDQRPAVPNTGKDIPCTDKSSKNLAQINLLKNYKRLCLSSQTINDTSKRNKESTVVNNCYHSMAPTSKPKNPNLKSQPMHKRKNKNLSRIDTAKQFTKTMKYPDKLSKNALRCNSNNVNVTQNNQSPCPQNAIHHKLCTKEVLDILNKNQTESINSNKISCIENTNKLLHKSTEDQRAPINLKKLSFTVDTKKLPNISTEDQIEPINLKILSCAENTNKLLDKSTEDQRKPINLKKLSCTENTKKLLYISTQNQTVPTNLYIRSQIEEQIPFAITESKNKYFSPLHENYSQHAMMMPLQTTNDVDQNSEHEKIAQNYLPGPSTSFNQYKYPIKQNENPTSLQMQLEPFRQLHNQEKHIAKSPEIEPKLETVLLQIIRRIVKAFDDKTIINDNNDRLVEFNKSIKRIIKVVDRCIAKVPNKLQIPSETGQKL